MQKNIEKKKSALEKILSSFETLIIAFSGGVDSTLLLAVAQKVMGGRVVAVTFDSPVHPKREIESAVRMAEVLGVTHKLLESDTISPPELAANSRDRCYYCKKELGESLRKIADELDIAVIAHGANLDDLNDFRPGQKAAREMGLIAPLMDAGLTKAEIRTLSKEMGLPTWNKPALACLATRIPYGTPITTETLEKIEQAENIILDLGFSTCRVRCHENTARLELDSAELNRMLEPTYRKKIVTSLRKLGFLYVALDLEGYGQGKMNRN
jgi:uncharacterized protein